MGRIGAGKRVKVYIYSAGINMKRIFFSLVIIALFTSPLFARLVKVEVRQGDTLHAFASKYLKDPSQWPEIYKLNKDTIKDPHRIFPGQIIKIPVEMLKDKVGDLTKIKKDVKVKKREGGGWSDGKYNDRLFPEDGIMTGRQSEARVDFLVGSTLKVYENSLIYLKPSKQKTAVASLLEGGLNVKEAKIITPSAEVVPAVNSEYDVAVDKEKTTKVRVTKGEVDVKAQGKTVTVIRGFRTIVEMNKPPQSPVALPLDGEEALEFKDDLAAVQNISFRFQVAEDKTFNKPVKEEKTDDLSLNYIKEDLKPGQYYWRVAIIDKDGFQGEYSRPRAFVVRSKSNAAVELTGFEIINRQEGVMRVKGYARNASRVVVNGYPAVIDAEGNFTTTIVLSPGQSSITLTAISSEGVILRKYSRTDNGMWLPTK